MTVLTQGIGEGDFELQRYGDCRIGVNWKEDLGGYYAPKDFTGWSVLSDDTFDYCSRGRWRIVGKSGGKTELVGHGNYRVC